jgi:hypothetical protein
LKDEFMAGAATDSSVAVDFSVVGLVRKVPAARWLLPALISLATFFTFAYFGQQHPIGTYSTETDFYHLFAPDADRLAAGQFPDNDFHPPGYAALIMLVTKLAGDTFTAGKWVSIISAALLPLFIFALFARLFGYWVGVGTAALFAVGPEIPQYAISATTDVYFLLLCVAALVVFTSERLPAAWRAALTGAVTSVAYLTRYNGLFLFAAFLFAIVALNAFGKTWRARLALAALFVAVFFAAASPWLYANYTHRGSPFYNVNYLNIATAFYPELVDGNVFQDGTRPLREKFHSFGDVLAYDPLRIVAQYPVNLFRSFLKTFDAKFVVLWLGVLGVVGFALALWQKRRSKPVLTLLAALVVYFLLMGLNHWEARYYFFIGVGFTGLALYAAVEGLRLLRQRAAVFRHPVFGLLPLALFVAAFAHAFVYAKQNMTEFLGSHPMEVVAARDFIRQQHGDKRGLRIVARKPHLAYLAGQEWVFFPQVKSVEDLRLWLEENRVDYVAVGTRELKDRKGIKIIGDPKSAPTWLEAAWVSQKPLYILYKPKVTPRGKPDLAEGQSAPSSLR